MADMTQQQIAQLPNLAEALPPPPAFIQNEKSVLTTWDFVNSLYKELAEVPERQFNLMNKVRRAIAPGLLIGLQLIFQYSLSEIEKIAPGTLATRVPSLDGRATQWAQAGAEAIARAKRWTADTRKAKLRRSDPNNNHTILDLIQYYRKNHHYWVVVLATENLSILKRVLSAYRRGQIDQSHSSFKDLRIVRLHYQRAIALSYMLGEYVKLLPAAKEAVTLNLEMTAKELREGLAELETSIEIDVSVGC